MYFHHKKARSYHAAADDIEVQEEFLKICENLTGVKFPY